jgi:hypothetical protein
MPAWTLEEAQAKLTEWKAAETRVAQNQAYTIYGAGGTGRAMTMANLAEIRGQIEYYSNLVTKLERGGMRVRRGVPE